MKSNRDRHIHTEGERAYVVDPEFDYYLCGLLYVLHIFLKVFWLPPNIQRHSEKLINHMCESVWKSVSALCPEMYCYEP